MDIRLIFQIVITVILCKGYIQARAVPSTQDKEGFGYNNEKGASSHFMWNVLVKFSYEWTRQTSSTGHGKCRAHEVQYNLGDIMIEKSGVEKCKMYICTDDNFKLLEEMHCTADGIHDTETKMLMKHIKAFIKQLKKNKTKIFRIYANSGMRYLRIQQKQKRFETTMLPSTPTPGCYGFSHTTGKSGNWCYGIYCDQYGNAIHWDNFNCGPTTPTTTPPTTKTPFYTTPLYCIYKHNGQFSFHKGGSSFVNLDGVKCKCTFYGRIECDPDNVVG